MKLPNWFKIIWWLFLTGLVTWILHIRYSDLTQGRSTPLDVFVFLIWVGLLLAPLFNEVSFFGIKLKQEIEDLKRSIITQISDIKTEIRSAVDVSTTFSPQITIPAPVTDAQLPALEEKIKAAVSEALLLYGKPTIKDAEDLSPPEDVTLLFTVRYKMEKELRRIAENSQISNQGRRPSPIIQLVRLMVQKEVIEPKLGEAIREVYAVCSPAVHGESVSQAQISFVKDVGPGLIAALAAIS